MMRGREDEDRTSAEPEPKRRRLRKGTRSCWDCKKRKVRCTFEKETDSACIPCRRRGADCIGQDHDIPVAEDAPHENSIGPLFHRVRRVEYLLEELLRKGQDIDAALAKLASPDAACISDLRTPSSYSASISASGHNQEDVSEALPVSPMHTVDRPLRSHSDADRWQATSQELIDAFPSQQDIHAMCTFNKQSTFCLIETFMRLDVPRTHAARLVNDLARIPSPSTHPVLLARRMLMIALLPQQVLPQSLMQMKEPASVVMRRLAETATRLVTSNDQLVACLEGIHCLMLEGFYQGNYGNLRLAWLAFRKAMATAQLMRIDREGPPPMKSIDSSSLTLDPTSLWLRIVKMNNFLSLMLGLSHGSPEVSMVHLLPSDEPADRLERACALLAGRILERNRHEETRRDWPITREIDFALLDVARNLPESYWRLPSFSTVEPYTEEAFTEQTRLIGHLFYFNLVHLLHLPFLLGNSDDIRLRYSQTTCVNASREILHRVIAFRAFSHKTCDFRIADFLALMAGMSILLAHIDSHQSACGSWYAHQRSGDRTMVEQIIENMELVAAASADKVTAQSSAVLRSLLKVETMTAQGQSFSHDDTLGCLKEQCDEVALPIPYFGIIKIGAHGSITKETEGVAAAVEGVSNAVPAASSVLPESRRTQQPLYAGLDAGSFGLTPHAHQLASPTSELPMVAANHSFPHQQTLYPGLCADINDWAFQGVDAAFFDNLMTGQ